MITATSLLFPLLLSLVLFHSAAVSRSRANISGTASSPCSEGQTSEICLGCHDGSSAPAVRAESSHPCGVLYDQAQSGGRRFLRPSNAASGFGSTIANDLLCDGRVECSSCHLPHGSESADRFRLRTRDGVFATLCRGCHDPR